MTQVEIARKALEAKIEGMRKTFEIDCKAGASDGSVGIYDKWYRSNRKDHGDAYTAAWTDAYKASDIKTIQYIN